jgi:2-iminoacetate synthase
VPRIRPADDINPADFPNGVPDDMFCHIVAVIRLAVPYTGMIISTRESQEVRRRVLEIGISQISGASCTSVGGYADKEPEEESSAQFDTNDKRTLDEVIAWLMKLGYIPSFCTACYRAGRTGERFMAICKSGKIQNCCTPNALMTLKEYLMDYAKPETKAMGEKIIAEELLKIANPKVRELATQHVREIEEGQRDFRF